MQADLCVIENFVQNLIIILSCRSYKDHDEIKVRQRTKAFLRSSHKIRTSFFLLFASHRRLSIKKNSAPHILPLEESLSVCVIEPKMLDALPLLLRRSYK